MKRNGDILRLEERAQERPVKDHAHSSALPGFGLGLGCSLAYLGLVVALPLAAIVAKTAGMDWGAFLELILDPGVLAAYRMSFGTSLAAAAINIVFGTLTAWALVRYDFAGRSLLAGIVDLPFALPTAVAGIALTVVCSPGGLIAVRALRLGIKMDLTPLGAVIALTFVSLPFVVRSMEPVIRGLAEDAEEVAEASEIAGVPAASPWQVLRLVILPALRPALSAGFVLAFARALGEYGSVVFISGTMPVGARIVPHLLNLGSGKPYDVAGSAAIAVALMAAALVMMTVINLMQWWSRHETA